MLECLPLERKVAESDGGQDPGLLDPALHDCCLYDFLAHHQHLVLSRTKELILELVIPSCPDRGLDPLTLVFEEVVELLSSVLGGMSCRSPTIK